MKHQAACAARTFLGSLLGAALLFTAVGAAAQVYRSVDQNGKIVFSDQAPGAASAPTASGPAISSVGNGPQLPYELRQVAQRYPVTIYTSEDCVACGAGRSLLTSRGVPFQEKTVKSGDDIAALQRLSGQSGLPLLTIGTQQLTGFSDAEWSQYLDAAGYPPSTQLPSGWRNPPAQPLVAVQRATAPAPAAAPSQAPAAAVPPPADSGSGSAVTPSNPAGIKF